MKVSKVVLSGLLGWGMVSMSVASTSPAANTEAKPGIKSPVTATQNKIRQSSGVKLNMDGKSPKTAAPKPKVKGKNNNKASKPNNASPNASSATQNKIRQSRGVKLNMSDQSPNPATQKNTSATTQNSASTQNSTTTQNKLRQSSGVNMNMVDP